MDKNEKKLDATLEKWRKGTATIEEIRSLAQDLGAYQHTPGIPALLELLDHKDDIVRYNAAESLAMNFNYTPATGRLLTMLAGDADEDCRSMAATCLGGLCHGTKNHAVLATLARASIEDLDEYVRDSAYRSLLIVNGVSKEEHLSFFRNPPHVDPERVRSILGKISEAK